MRDLSLIDISSKVGRLSTRHVSHAVCAIYVGCHNALNPNLQADVWH